MSGGIPVVSCTLKIHPCSFEDRITNQFLCLCRSLKDKGDSGFRTEEPNNPNVFKRPRCLGILSCLRSNDKGFNCDNWLFAVQSPQTIEMFHVVSQSHLIHLMGFDIVEFPFIHSE